MKIQKLYREGWKESDSPDYYTVEKMFARNRKARYKGVAHLLRKRQTFLDRWQYFLIVTSTEKGEEVFTIKKDNKKYEQKDFCNLLFDRAYEINISKKQNYALSQLDRKFLSRREKELALLPANKWYKIATWACAIIVTSSLLGFFSVYTSILAVVAYYFIIKTLLQ